MSNAPRDELRRRGDAIEESYEFMLAFAAQGIADDGGSKSGSQLRRFLEKSDQALTGFADLVRQLVDDESLQPADRYRAFIDVLARDADAAQAAIQLVRAQPKISSQLVDNLNASIHLRALLTDLFLLDELVKLGIPDVARTPAS